MVKGLEFFRAKTGVSMRFFSQELESLLKKQTCRVLHGKPDSIGAELGFEMR